MALWRLSLSHVKVERLGEYGLPPALPATWYAAVAVAVLGTVVSITVADAPRPLIAIYLMVVALILFGTVPALSAQPHYAWVYKHIGVVRYLELHGRVDNSIDIYNRWPGFFALAAAFSSLAGEHNPASYAAWADLMFVLLDLALVTAIVKAVAGDWQIAAGAGLLFVITDWVGQTYFSPQAFGYVLSLALVLVLLRQLRVASPAATERLRRLIERVVRAPQLPVEIDVSRRWPRPLALTVTLVLDAVIVASHQLTPYMILAGVALLMLVGVLRPWWLLTAMAAMTLGYLAANFQFIQHNYGIFTSIDPFNNVQGPKVAQHPAPGKVFNAEAQLLFIAAIWIATIGSIMRLARCGLLLRALPLVVLAICPLVIVFGQNYGGEASLRVVLFSSPWCAALIAWALRTRLIRWRACIAFSGVALVFTSLFVVSYLGQEELNIISPAELRASEWFYAHARRGSVLVLAAPGFPYRSGGSYPEFRGPEGDANPNLMTEHIFTNRPLGSGQVPDIAERIRVYAPRGYIAFTRDETAYAELFRLTPVGQLERLRQAVGMSQQFRLWYANRDAQIYELVPAVHPQAAQSMLNDVRRARHLPHPARHVDRHRLRRRSRRSTGARP